MKIKALSYLIANNKKLFLIIFLKHPFIYTYRYLKSLLSPPPKHEDGAILFGVKDLNNFKSLIEDNKNPLILGFSYCQKPLDCPAPRFSKYCLGQSCSKCLISRYINKKNIYTFPITTISELSQKIYQIIEQKNNKNSQILFIISACPLSISMFKDFSKVLNLKGIALPISGDVCKDFKTFFLAEEGNKPSQTLFSKKNEQLLDKLLKERTS